MESLYVLMVITIIGFLWIDLRHRYIQYQEDKEFFITIDAMIKEKDEKFNEKWDKALEDMKPFIIDMVKKCKNQNES
jgi:hypothetical protein